jgi:hypothetical protein
MDKAQCLDKLAEAVRLHNVYVGACIQAIAYVLGVAAGRKHNNRNVFKEAIALNNPQTFFSVGYRHINIQEYVVNGVVDPDIEVFKSVHAIRSLKDLQGIVDRAQRIDQELPVFRVIINNNNFHEVAVISGNDTTWSIVRPSESGKLFECEVSSLKAHAATQVTVL